ncbi:hypothetical protein [Kiloniella sp.]|uniref:hypothetical protein n=1 Tax=Kiloniella sp. TaxID=1938587 RepID=UPI003A8EEB08
MNIDDEIEKLKFQVEMLGQAVDFEKFPITSLVFEFGWNKDQLDAVYNCFEEAENLLDDDSDSFNHAWFEQLFHKSVGVGYQGLKAIVLSFYREQRYMNVCVAYVKSMGERVSVEYHRIQQDIAAQEEK